MAFNILNIHELVICKDHISCQSATIKQLIFFHNTQELEEPSVLFECIVAENQVWHCLTEIDVEAETLELNQLLALRLEWLEVLVQQVIV